MKSICYALTVAVILSFASCSDNDEINYITEDQLPEKVQTFLQTYFGNNEFISATEVPFYGGSYLEVGLKDVEINFTPDNDWNSIVSADGLPASADGLIHEKTLKELKEREPNAKIKQLHNRYGKEVDIWTGSQKRYSDIVGHEGNTLAEFVTDAEDLPEQIKEYISQYVYGTTRTSVVSEYPKMLKFAVHKGAIYRCKLSFDTFVDFYEDGNWFYVQEEETAAQQIIADRLIMAVPEGVLSKLKTEDQSVIQRIRKINVFNDNKDYGFNKIYGFTLDDGGFMAINAENEQLEIPYDAVREYIDKGFNPLEGYKVYAHVNTGGAFLFRYSFVIAAWSVDPTLPISLTTNAQGEMRRISSGVVSTDHTRVTPLPRAVIEMLPHSIAAFLDEHFPDWKAVSIDCAYSEGYGPEIPQQTIDVQMSVPNNLKTAVFDYATGEFIKQYLTIQR